jgi:hypothetical protein
MSAFSKSLLHVLRTVEGVPFEKRGVLYQEGLLLFGQLHSDYRDWRVHIFCRYIERFSMITSVELVLDVDEEEGLSEFWGITLYAEGWEAYLPIHWLKDAFVDHTKGSYGIPRTHFVNGLAKRGIVVDSLFWERMQGLTTLVWEDLSFWSGVSEVFVRSKSSNQAY